METTRDPSTLGTKECQARKKRPQKKRKKKEKKKRSTRLARISSRRSGSSPFYLLQVLPHCGIPFPLTFLLSSYRVSPWPSQGISRLLPSLTTQPLMMLWLKRRNMLMGRRQMTRLEMKNAERSNIVSCRGGKLRSYACSFHSLG